MSVPALRFKDDGQEFPEWEEKILEELADVSTGNKDTQNKIDDGLYPFYVRSQTVERINSFAYDGEAILTSGDGVGVGKNFHYINGKFDYHQRVYCIFNFKNQVSGLYIFYYFSEKFYKRVMGLSAKNSVDSIRRSMITEMLISIPTLPEQTKIANFLTAVDDKITLLTKKADLLSQYKKGVMQQIFSQELRFKDDDGQEFPEWEVKTLGEVCKPQQWKTISASELTEFGYPAYGANGQIGFYSEYNHEDETIAVTCRGATCGEVTLIPPKSYITGNSMSLDYINSNKNNHRYVYYALTLRGFRDVISGSAQPQIVGSAIRRVEFSVPSFLEQTKIANFLTAIDEKITNNQTQLDAVKQYKHGLLQQMFV